MAPGILGLELISVRRFAEGISHLKAALAAWDASRLRNFYFKAALAEAKAMVGELDDALQLIDEAIEQNRAPRLGRTHSLRRDPATQRLYVYTPG